MNGQEELSVLKEMLDDLNKMFCKCKRKAAREREKLARHYIVIKGEKYYSEQEIMDAYACDLFSSAQCDRYLDKLKLKLAETKDNKETPHEYLTRRYSFIIKELYSEIEQLEFDLQTPEEKKAYYDALEKELHCDEDCS